MNSKNSADSARHQFSFLPAIFFAVFVFYALNSYNLGFVYDDQEQILARAETPVSISLRQTFMNPHYSNLAYYRPLARLSLDIQLSLFGKWPAGYHLFSSFLGAVLAVLLFRMLTILMPEAERLILSGATLCTALHPVFSSCVFMISAQEVLLVGIFIIAAATAFLKKQPLQSALLTLAALFCRENAASLPALLLMICLCDSRKTEYPRFYDLLPTLLLTGIYFWLRRQAVPAGTISEIDFSGPFTAGIYLFQTILFPEPQLVYEPAVAVWFSAFSPIPTGLTIFAFYKIGRLSSNWDQLKFWLMWLFIMFLPTANLIGQQTPFDERHNLIILPVFTFMLAFFAGNIFRRNRRAAVAGIILLVTLLGGMSHYRAQFFRDDFTFASQWLRTDPEAGEAYAIFGRLFMEKGQRQQAITMFEQSVRFRPNMASSHDSLGYLYSENGRTDLAEACFKNAVALDPTNSIYRYNLSQNLGAAKMYTESYAQISLAGLFAAPGTAGYQSIQQRLAEAHAEIIVWTIALTSPIL